MIKIVLFNSLSSLVFKDFVAVQQAVFSIIVHHSVACQAPEGWLLRDISVVICDLLSHRLIADVTDPSVHTFLHHEDQSELNLCKRDNLSHWTVKQFS